MSELLVFMVDASIIVFTASGSMLIMDSIEKPDKLSARKIFGIHFHCLVIHFPEIYHLFCLRSLIPEDEERTFGDLGVQTQSIDYKDAELVLVIFHLRYCSKS
jgi:hypothetical protein